MGFARPMVLSILCVLLLLFSPFSAGTGDRIHGCFIKSIYQLGDSMADTGNLIREGTGQAFAAITRYPYGMTSFHKPTGRCSDGYLMIDYFAKGLGLPLLQPYLDREADFSHGVNFAVAGATALDKSFFMERGITLPFTNSSLDVQLGWFRSHLDSICSKDVECSRKKLRRSVVFVGEIGGNDYNYALFTGKPVDEVQAYVPRVVGKIVEAAKEVIRAGAAHLVVPGNYPIGCMPAYLTAFGGIPGAERDSDGCIAGLNSFAAFHNGALQEALAELRRDHPLVTIMYADYYDSFLSILRNKTSSSSRRSRSPPARWGRRGARGVVSPFDKGSALKACCGGGGEYNFDPANMCGATGTTVCPSPSRAISWDGVHLTQGAYQMMTAELTFGGHTQPGNQLWKKWMCFHHHRSS